MYNLIFYFFYRYHKRRQDSTPSLTGMVAVSSVLAGHIFLIVNLISFFTGYKVLGGPFSEDYTLNKLYLLPFSILYFLIIVFYYNKKRVEKIKQQWKDKDVLTFKNGMIIFIVAVLPVVIAIKLLNAG